MFRLRQLFTSYRADYSVKFKNIQLESSNPFQFQYIHYRRFSLGLQVVLEALMDQGLTEPKYLGLVTSGYKTLMRIPRDINGLRRVSEGQE